MKNYIYLTLLTFILISCKKKNVIPEVIDVRELHFASDRILQKTHKPFNIGLWFKIQGMYEGTESFSLTINGIEAKESKIPKSAGAVDKMILFDIPAINQAGEYKAIFKYKIGKSSFISEKTIRVVEDFSISKIWNNLSQAYTKGNPIFVYIYQTEGFWFHSPREIVLASNSVGGTQQGIGEYRSNFIIPSKPFKSNPLIAGLDGEYHVYYKGNQIEEIRVFFQEPPDDQKLDINLILNQMRNIYGPEVGYTGSQLFKSGDFDIQIHHEYFGFTQAIIRKVR